MSVDCVKKWVSSAWHRSGPLLGPNCLTLTALCLGLFSLRSAFFGCWTLALQCMTVAILLDFLDGYVARLLGMNSSFGAQLDSLVDFLCYGVVPAILAHHAVFIYWTDGWGWVCCCFFASCSAVRLALFNVRAQSASHRAWEKFSFSGVPAPAAALLACLPFFMMLSVQGQLRPTFILKNALVTTLIISGVLMLLPFPTLSLKHVKALKKPPLLLLIFGLLLAGFYCIPWIFLSLLMLTYIICMPFVAWLAIKKVKLCTM